MNKLIDVLIYTGGHPSLRKKILHLIRTMNLQQGEDVSSVKAVFLMLKKYLESDDRDEGTYRLYKAVENYVYGDGEVEEVRRSYGDLTKTLGAGSSALIENLEDASPRPTPKLEKRVACISVIEAVLLLLIPIILYGERHYTRTWKPPLVSLPDFTEIIAHIEEGKLIGPQEKDQSYPFDKTYPTANLPTGAINERIRQTLYMEKSALKNTRPLQTQGNILSRISFDTETVQHTYFENTWSDVHTRGSGVFSSTADYTLNFAGDINRESVDVMFKLQEWIEYTMRAVDPTYRLSVSGDLTIVVSPTPPRGYGQGMLLMGLMNTNVKTIWLKYEPRDNYGHTMVETFIHEYAHLIHMYGDDVASDCPTGICKNRRQVTAEPQDVMRWKDKVDLVLSLGIELHDLSYEEAVALNKDILDIRIREIYDNIRFRPVYERYRRTYAMTNHQEFWAEACRSYVFGIVHPGVLSKTGFFLRKYNFPSNADIREGDPALFALLQEVWTNLGDNWA
ncbi:unnamed protein product [Ectocarpus sp. 6 AP-2014]